MSDVVKIPQGISEIRPRQIDRDKNLTRLKTASQMYEQHFLQEMVKAMRATVSPGFQEPTFGEKIYREQLDQQYVDAWSKRGEMGLAEMIYKQMSEKLFPDPSSRLPPPKGPIHLQKPPLPIHSESPVIPIKKIDTTSTDMLLQYDLKDQPSPVTSPWSGRINQIATIDGGTATVRIAHSPNLSSLISFHGLTRAVKLGDEVQAGQKLGDLDPTSPQLSWRVTKTGA